MDTRTDFVTMPAMRTVRTAVLGMFASALIMAACAKGAESGDDTGDDTGDPDAPVTDDIDAPVSTIDANVNPPVDGNQTPDAFVPPPPDAFVPPPDAAVVNPPFCDANDQCVEPGTCCFVLACVEGTAIGSACFPA